MYNINYIKNIKYSKSQFLMGIDIDIIIFSENNPLEDIYNSFGILYSLEKEFTRFKNNSDLSLLNLKKELEVSNRFIYVINLSKQIYKNSEGYFNPLVNISNIGYSTDFGKGVFNKLEQENNLDLDKISIIGNFLTLKENHILDLGGIVKGYGVDLISEYLKDKGYNDFIINAGGNIIISGKECFMKNASNCYR